MPAVPPAAAAVFAPLADLESAPADAPAPPHEHDEVAPAECGEIETCC